MESHWIGAMRKLHFLLMCVPGFFWGQSSNRVWRIRPLLGENPVGVLIGTIMPVSRCHYLGNSVSLESSLASHGLMPWSPNVKSGWAWANCKIEEQVDPLYLRLLGYILQRIWSSHHGHNVAMSYKWYLYAFLILHILTCTAQDSWSVADLLEDLWCFDQISYNSGRRTVLIQVRNVFKSWLENLTSQITFLWVEHWCVI